MAVDLSDLIDSLKREVSPPGAEETTFPEASDATYLGHLRDAFWEARLDGMLEDYTELDGDVTPSDEEDDDITRDLQQLLVLYAGIRIIRNHLININTTFRAKAGPVEYETGKSAQLLKAILDELRVRRNLVLERLSDVGVVDTYVIDAILTRDQDLGWGTGYWWG